MWLTWYLVIVQEKHQRETYQPQTFAIRLFERADSWNLSVGSGRTGHVRAIGSASFTIGIHLYFEAMSTPSSSSRTGAQAVQHSFDGDVKILNATFDRRMEMRKALTAVQHDLQRTEGRPVQVKADIKFRIGGKDAKEHSYTVTATSSDFDIDDFIRQIPLARSDAVPTAGKGLSSSPAPTTTGQQTVPAQSTPRPESRKADDDVVEIRPFKRQKADVEKVPSTPSVDVANAPTNTGSKDMTDIFDFLKKWHAEWVRQGGFIYDQLSTSQPFMQSKVTTLEKRMDGVQDVLGQSMNTASANTMAELTNISKLIPWLEHCRKTSADKVQAREEKWRTSSATFHDQTRREREAAEKRIEKKLEEQRELLVKVAQASGIDLEELDGPNGAGPDGSREQSLGAQLTAELNTEAEKGRAHETINIDDD